MLLFELLKLHINRLCVPKDLFWRGLPSDLKSLPRLRNSTGSGVAGSVKHASEFQGEEPEHSGHLGSTGILARALCFSPLHEKHRDGEVCFFFFLT